MRDEKRDLRRRQRATGLALATGLLAAALGGCAPAFKETYYVGVYNQKEPGAPMQFYRFRMYGTVDFGSKLKFQSGWYPKEALCAFVGEQRDVSGRGYEHDKGADVVVVGPEGAVKALREQYLVVMMATDPGPITNAIGSIASAISEQGSAAFVAYRAQRQERIRQQQELRRTRTRAGLTLIGNVLPAGANSEALLGQLRDVVLPQLSSMQAPTSQPSGGAE